MLSQFENDSRPGVQLGKIGVAILVFPSCLPWVKFGTRVMAWKRTFFAYRPVGKVCIVGGITIKIA